MDEYELSAASRMGEQNRTEPRHPSSSAAGRISGQADPNLAMTKTKRRTVGVDCTFTLTRLTIHTKCGDKKELQNQL